MRLIVRLRSLASVPALLAAAAALALLPVGGCGSGEEDTAAAPPPEEAPGGGSRFGNDYEVLTSAYSAGPEEPPALRGDTLALAVAYRGGRETHGFDLRYDTRSDTARLWLRHDAEGDRDSTRLLDDLRLPVPPEALRASTVLLLNPQGGEPFVLRWDGE